jgi:hypothetical protein
MKINIGCRDCDFDKYSDLSSKTATSNTVGVRVCNHLMDFPDHRVEVTKIYDRAEMASKAE